MADQELATGLYMAPLLAYAKPVEVLPPHTIIVFCAVFATEENFLLAAGAPVAVMLLHVLVARSNTAPLPNTEPPLSPPQITNLLLMNCIPNSVRAEG